MLRIVYPCALCCRTYVFLILQGTTALVQAPVLVPQAMEQQVSLPNIPMHCIPE